MEKSFENKGINNIVAEMYLEFERRVLPALSGIVDETKRFLYFTAWLNKKTEDLNLGRVIVTGGFAVEVYTGRLYRTMDVDIVIEGPEAREVVEKFLSMFSEKIARGYLPRYEVLELKSIDIVSTTYNRELPPSKINVNGLYVYIEPVEELVIVYLQGWKYWGSTEDRDKALWLYATWREKLDLPYLYSKAREKQVEDYLEKLVEMATS